MLAICNHTRYESCELGQCWRLERCCPAYACKEWRLLPGADLTVNSKGGVQRNGLLELEVGLYGGQQRREFHLGQLGCALIQQRLYLDTN